jgi:hypothetical protein
MLQFKTTLLRLLALSYLATFIHAGVCDVTNGLVGRDSGVAVFAAFEYNLTVKDKITPAVVEASILPSLEKSFASKASKVLITACAPPGRVVVNDIVGMDIEPADYVVGRCGSGKGNCYAIHSETTIFVLSTGRDTAAVYRNTLKSLFRNNTFVPVNANIVSMTGFRVVVADLAAGSDPADGKDQNAFVKVLQMPNDDPVIFWILIAALVVVSIVAIYLTVVCCCPYDRNGDRKCILKC